MKIERERIITTRMALKEQLKEEREQGQKVVQAIESVFNQRVTQLKEKIETEKYERRIAEQAQLHAISAIQKEIKQDKKKEIERFEDLTRI